MLFLALCGTFGKTCRTTPSETELLSDSLASGGGAGAGGVSTGARFSSVGGAGFGGAGVSSFGGTGLGAGVTTTGAGMVAGTEAGTAAGFSSTGEDLIGDAEPLFRNLGRISKPARIKLSKAVVA